MENINFKNVPQSDYIIILAAGPSINKNIDTIKEYYQKKSTIVISANYNHAIPADYTVFVDKKRYKEQKNSIKGKIITGGRINWQKDKHLYNKILPIKHNAHPSYLQTKKIIVKSNGKINHEVGNAGFASILISIFFKPKKILAAGFDGPDSKANFKHFDGHTTIFKQIKTKLNLNRKFLTLLIGFLQKRNIKVFVFKNDNFWKLNKNKIGLKIY